MNIYPVGEVVESAEDLKKEEEKEISCEICSRETCSLVRQTKVNHTM